MELCQLTIKEAQEGLRKKKFSSVELVTSCLERIKKLNPQINAFLTVCEKEALEQAEEADKQISNFPALPAGRQFPISNFPLLGIPIAIKDNFCTQGIRTTAASKVLEDWIPSYDATVVARLKEAGAIIVGKANMDAWGHGSSGENSDFGPTHNPGNSKYVPGGSSSGSAVAVATGMSLAATGTDTGGSLRLPAAFCGIVGLKPSYGRVSRYGIIAMASSLDSIGHLTKTVTDAAIVLKVTAGPDGKDATCPPVSVPDYREKIDVGIGGLRIGVPKEYFLAGMDSQVKEKTQQAIKLLGKLGAEIREISLPHTQYANACYYIIQPAEVSSNLARYDGIRYGNGRETFGDEARRRIMLGTYTLSAGYYEAYYLRAMKVRTLVKKDFERAFQAVDVIIAPVSPTLPWKLGEKVDDPLKMYLSDIFTVTANLAGLPALAVPAGFSDDLPIGMQILGPQFSEELLFRVGFVMERENDV